MHLDVSIVIPVYNALPLAQQCLESVYAHGSALDFEIIVVDNGSAPDVPAWIAQQQPLHPNLRYLRYEEPLGFARSVNVGAAAATGDVLIVLNSDTIVTAGWMDALHRALLDDPSLGAITPATNHAGEPAQMDYGTIDLSAARALAVRAARPIAPDILYLPQRLTFFCVALRRETWLAFDGLDETYRVGNFEDDDLCLRLRVAGYRLGVALHVFVYHHNNATFNANKISHNDWMAHNASVFADHARACAEDPDPPAPRWPRRSEPDISVVILPGSGPNAEAELSRTLRSLANQTLLDFEIVLPPAKDGLAQAPTRTWLAYVTQGDILYPFHLEALHEALTRNAADAIFADGWIAGQSSPTPHPDAPRLVRSAPSLLAGWMHHASLDPALLWEQSVPMHWPRLTWEMQHPPALPAHSTQKPQRSLVDAARDLYRSLVPLETRLRLDARIRKLIGRPAVSPAEAQLRQLAAELNSLIAAGTGAGQFATGATLPAIFTFNAVPWDSLIQRQHHFARGLAERGHQVFWIDPPLSPARNWATGRALRQVAPGIHLLRLPAHARDIYTMPWDDAVLAAQTAALAQVAAAYGIGQAVALVNYPRWQPLAMSIRDRCGWKLAYDCLDDQRALADVYQTPYSRYEDDLIDAADLILTSSAVLHERMSKPSILLHNATDFDLFSTPVRSGLLDHLPRPVIGFFGALADWLDMDLIHAAAAHFPDWSFVYIGPHTFSRSEIEVNWMRATDLPNITVLPQMDPRPLAAHLAEFDVCTVPFLDIPVTRSMNPVKLYEYLSAGKPCVSRDLPEVRHLVAGQPQPDELVALYSTPQEFFARLEEALATDTPARATRRRHFASHNDWAARVEILSTSLTALSISSK